jgi:hypothetical protein
MEAPETWAFAYASDEVQRVNAAGMAATAMRRQARGR